MSKIITEDNKPLFKHDCDECTYLGSELLDGKKYDLYIHVREGYVEYLARYSSIDMEYICTPSHCDSHNPIIRICQLLYETGAYK